MFDKVLSTSVSSATIQIHHFFVGRWHCYFVFLKLNYFMWFKKDNAIHDNLFGCGAKPIQVYWCYWWMNGTRPVTNVKQSTDEWPVWVFSLRIYTKQTSFVNLESYLKCFCFAFSYIHAEYPSTGKIWVNLSIQFKNRKTQNRNISVFGSILHSRSFWFWICLCYLLPGIFCVLLIFVFY